MSEDRVVIVTGAGGGLGAEIVSLLSARGVTVVATDINENALKQCGDERKTQGDISVYVADITDQDAVAGVVSDTIGRYGRIDALSNNAAIQGAVKPFLEYEEDELWRVMRANYFSSWLTMKQVIPQMIKQGGGSIVNTGSSLAYRGWKEVPAYVSAKHALAGLTRSVAIEFAMDNIRVNLLCPSSMDTPMLAPVATSTGDGDTALGYERILAMIPSRRLAPPPEVAKVAEFLLLDAPRHLSGVTLPVDGAETAG
jgi:NAD(P)-dependent dehydrogenase (short-subunit alcohol dehydrogenase family)